TPDSAGLEYVALQTMIRRSLRYPYERIQDLLDETSSTLQVQSTFEYSTVSLGTLNKYLENLLPLWADCIVAPVFSELDFSQVLSDARLALQAKEQDPWATTALVMNREFFGNHPYGNVPEGTVSSLAKIDLDAVRRWYQESFSANRLFVVAVGNIDSALLKTLLETSIGTIPDRKVPLPKGAPKFTEFTADASQVSDPRGATPQGRSSEERGNQEALHKGSSRLVKVDYPQSRGLAYLRGDFPAPSPADRDYMPLNIGMKMLSDLFFHIIRDTYGATYSPGAYIRNFPANYGSLVIYKTKVPFKVKAYIDEAVAELAAGRCMSVEMKEESEASVEQFTSIDQALSAYKALFLSEYYHNQQTNAQQAHVIINSVVTTGDYRSYLLDMERIEAVQAQDIQRVFEQYVLNGTYTWVLTGSKDVLDPVRLEDFSR
ncbi:MAG: insulinase family protein, partial [Termitinemataceae bacterium]